MTVSLECLIQCEDDSVAFSLEAGINIVPRFMKQEACAKTDFTQLYIILFHVDDGMIGRYIYCLICDT
jgi:hypothetical protein